MATTSTRTIVVYDVSSSRARRDGVSMQPGGVLVRLGQRVDAGQPLGRLGSSGDSLFTHLHDAVWSGPRPERDEGVPSSFEHFRRLLGSRALSVDRGPIDSGDFVESLYK